jgi:hypothetical protein
MVLVIEVSSDTPAVLEREPISTRLTQRQRAARYTPAFQACSEIQIRVRLTLARVTWNLNFVEAPYTGPGPLPPDGNGARLRPPGAGGPPGLAVPATVTVTQGRP